MSVTLTPTSLGFERPLTRLVKKVLIIKNENNHSIAFKVKTTSPKLFCVRPNAGRIESNESIEVQVLLQPMREDPPIGTKCRDKFLVQTVSITPERENASVIELWAMIESEDKALEDKTKASIHEQKIRCSYLPATNNPIDESSSSTSIKDDSSSSKVSNSTPPPSTTLSTESSSITSPPPSIVTESIPAISTSSPSVQPHSRSTTTTTTPSVPLPIISTTSTPSPSSSPPPPSEDFLTLQSELKASKLEILKLKQQIQDSEVLTSELRKRNTVANATIAAATASAQQEEKPRVQVAVESKEKVVNGIPVPVVVGVVLGVFIVTWLFL